MKYKNKKHKNDFKNEFWNEKEAKKQLFQIVHFYNVLIEKPKIKHLSNIELDMSFHFVMN